MKSLKVLSLIIALVALVSISNVTFAEDAKATANAATPAADASAAANAADQKISFEESNWAKRCQTDKDGKEDKSKCEVFKIIRVKENKGRIAEFAIGRSEEKGKQVINGVVILPLGILLEEGVLFKIDENSPVMFKPRFCAQVGCVSYVTLDDELMGQMKSGKKISFVFRSSNGQKVNVDLILEGFEKAFKGLDK